MIPAGAAGGAGQARSPLAVSAGKVSAGDLFQTGLFLENRTKPTAVSAGMMEVGLRVFPRGGELGRGPRQG